MVEIFTRKVLTSAYTGLDCMISTTIESVRIFLYSRGKCQVRSITSAKFRNWIGIIPLLHGTKKPPKLRLIVLILKQWRAMLKLRIHLSCFICLFALWFLLLLLFRFCLFIVLMTLFKSHWMWRTLSLLNINMLHAEYLSSFYAHILY